jgi:OOP family OmpA-OmpF porin
MKAFLPFIFTYLFCISFSATAQNLVPNPGFEELNEHPKKGDVTITCCKDWFASNMMATDYYNRLPGMWKGVPKNKLGYQEPHSGEAYAGICIDSKFIEYLQTKLLDTLAKGKKYLIEFYISKAEKSRGNIKEFGVLFSGTANKALSANGITKEPSVKFVNPFGYRNKKGWTKLSVVYQAKGFETYFILGHFTYDHPGYKKKYCHYYIDDVSITPMEKENDFSPKIEIKDSIHIATVETQSLLPQSFSPMPGETITLKNIFFATNKSELLPGSFSELDKLVQYLNATSDTSIKINGHTDKTGNEDENKTLSEARAKSVADYLILKKIDKSRVNYVGYGSSKPIATNDTDEGKQQNRRVEFIISKK